MGVLILIGSFIVLLLLGIPIALCLVVASVLTGLYLQMPLEVVGQHMLQSLNSYSILAIPLFILAGEIMGSGGISSRLIDLSNLLVGRFRGGLAMVNVVTCMFFGGITGSAVADASSIGSIMIPMMKKKGYPADYSVAVTCTAAIQGVIVPPSHNLILYSLAAGGVSINALFAAGILPGVVLCISLMVAAYIMAVKRNFPKGEVIPKERWRSIIIQGALSLTTALIIIGGIFLGIFTANESAAVAVLYAFLITTFVFKEMTFKKGIEIFVETFKKLAVVLFLISASAAFSFFMSVLNVPDMIFHGMQSVSHNKYVLLIMMNIFLLLLGLIMDMAPIILVATPIMLPLVTQVGMDPVQFGIILMLNLGIGLIHPPIGSALFVGCSIGGISMEKSFVAMLPLLGIMLIVLLVITYVPGVAMFLPHLMGAR
ncbi:TRAP transporter large permease [Neobacillus sp. PS3-12]|jgi:tripartite ATP-independent transporter DctM subunit|uniref:TRAP transporter large permease n=1 Tax=Neobacillus sp. PS3-12 TaxID=3070677 RepID=UPI0027E12D26|nr:TRAP transporter large permease [Neobacillus sp. PS3-12]WML52666.1 TRAP transporter large permease [Neobacillus sp. PS3-12]